MRFVASENDEVVSLHFNNCREVGHYGIVAQDKQKFRKIMYECRNDIHVEYGNDGMPFKPIVATEPVMIEQTCFDVPQQTSFVVEPQNGSSHVQPGHSLVAPFLVPPQSHSLVEQDDDSAVRALPNGAKKFVVPIDLSPLPSIQAKLLPGVSTLFGLGINSNTVATTSSCTLIGKYASSTSCSQYNHCYGFGRGQLGLTCPTDFAFDPYYKQCSLNWSSCISLARCTTNGELIADPTSNRNYFICIQSQTSIFKTSYSRQWMVYRRMCTGALTFNLANQRCQ